MTAAVTVASDNDSTGPVHSAAARRPESLTGSPNDAMRTATPFSARYRAAT